MLVSFVTISYCERSRGEIDADNLQQLETFHPCIFSFQYFIALKTISTFLERYLIRTYSMLYRIIVAQMCRIKQNFKNHTRFLHSAIECEERIYVVLVWYYKHRFKREKFTQVSISFVSNNTPQDIVISNQNPEDALLI